MPIPCASKDGGRRAGFNASATSTVPIARNFARARALKLGARSYRPIANILALGRENLPLPGEEPEERAVIVHENVRGPGYYH